MSFAIVAGIIVGVSLVVGVVTKFVLKKNPVKTEKTIKMRVRETPKAVKSEIKKEKNENIG